MRALDILIKKYLRFCCVALMSVLSACGGGGGGEETPVPPLALRLVQVGSSLALNFPVFVTAPPGDNTRLFVVEKAGVIKIIDLATQQVLPTPFIDLTSQIDSNGERGLLGLAFHPDFSTNRFFYVYLSNTSGNSEVRRYSVPMATPNVADPNSAQPIILVDQPPGLANHKAGWIGFGRDDLLYVALGDGGGGGDPGENAENLNSLLGKILRLDVNGDDFPGDPAANYAIPPDNPFVGDGDPLTRAEVWSYGLRNPFRNSFDRLTGDFYIADVGQDRREEVNVATGVRPGAGVNFGWDIMEGTLCFEPAGCNMGGLTLPLLEYAHDNNACSGSITGGYVYRGAAIPRLQGTYFYADFCQGFVRSFRFANGAATEQTDWVLLRPSVGGITSFGEDAAGELYITTSVGGLFRIVDQRLL